MACPLCGDPRGDDVCPACVKDGYVELICGCIECPNGTRKHCSDAHALCDSCGSEERQYSDTLCGDCRRDAEEEASQVATPKVARQQ
jgi:RecJ-like exonuclease